RLTGAVPEGSSPVAAIHDVAMNLDVLVRRADVDPIPAIHVSDECLSTLDQRREKTALDGPRHVFGDAIEGIRLQYVDPGVDGVAGNLVRRGLLQEALDIARRIGFDESVRARILDRRQHNRRLRLPLPMQVDDRRQIDFGKHVAVEDDHRFEQRFARIADGARGPERRGLDDVADAQASVAAVAEQLFDASRLVVQAQYDLVYI